MTVSEPLKSHFIEKRTPFIALASPQQKLTKTHSMAQTCGNLARLRKFRPPPPPHHRPRKSTQVTTIMEDLALYNLGYKALSLLITMLASVVMNRLLRRGPLGIGSVRVCVCVCVPVCVCV